MKKSDQIKALAELDGWIKLCRGDYVPRNTTPQERLDNTYAIPNYLSSYDAIIPLIQKQELGTRLRFYGNCLVLTRAYGLTDSPLELKPAQLAEALLRATGKWIE